MTAGPMGEVGTGEQVYEEVWWKNLRVCRELEESTCPRRSEQGLQTGTDRPNSNLASAPSPYPLSLHLCVPVEGPPH